MPLPFHCSYLCNRPFDAKSLVKRGRLCISIVSCGKEESSDRVVRHVQIDGRNQRGGLKYSIMRQQRLQFCRRWKHGGVNCVMYEDDPFALVCRKSRVIIEANMILHNLIQAYSIILVIA